MKHIGNTVNDDNLLTPKFNSCAEVNRFVGFNLLSEPSKMPEESFNIPAVKCKAGSYMVKQKDWVCYGCYALKGRGLRIIR